MNDTCYTVHMPHDGKLPKLIGWQYGEQVIDKALSEAETLRLALDLLKAYSLMRKFPG